MEQINPADTKLLMEKLQAYRISCAIHLAAKLELSELLRNGPRSVSDLAETCGVAPGPLYQIMRSLAAEGIYREESFEIFANTPLSSQLVRDNPGPIWSYSIIVGEVYMAAFANLYHSVKTGQSAFADLHGQSYWDYLGQHSDMGALFDGLMTRIYDGDVEYLLDLFDFPSLGRLLDVGGGRGSFVRALMARHPEVTCGLFDLPSVSERNIEEFARDGLSARCEVLSGSFLEAVPSGFNTYLIKNVLHNWGDDEALCILRNCRVAGGAKTRLAVVEFIVPPGNEPSFAKGLDLTMLAMFGGKERSLAQFERLLGDAGYHITSIVEGESQKGLGIILADPFPA